MEGQTFESVTPANLETSTIEPFVMTTIEETGVMSTEANLEGTTLTQALTVVGSNMMGDVRYVRETVVMSTPDVEWLKFALRAVEKLVLLGKSFVKGFWIGSSICRL